jgi:16S rRNA (guanine527-N7)-methyltransferase
MDLTSQHWQQARALCQSGMQQLALTTDAQQLDQLMAYLQVMLVWNRSYNLTAVREPVQAVSKHLLDSMSIVPWLADGPGLDAGSGAGLPGIPLAIIRPEQRWLLLDSNGKKVRFLRHVCRQLQLRNVTVMQQRLEQLQPQQVDADWRPVQIVTRALAPIRKQCEWALPWLQQGARLLAMVGELAGDEELQLPAGLGIVASIALQTGNSAQPIKKVVWVKPPPPSI